jgi:hypothetical protein
MTIFPHPLRRRVWNRRRPLTAPPVAGHACTGVGYVGGGYCNWHFDAVIEDPGDGSSMLVNGHAPDSVAFTQGDAYVACHYPTEPAPGDPWQYLGGDSPSFDDGQPGAPGSGVCSDG